MDNFDYKKYLAEGRLLKEEVDVLGNEFLQNIQDDMKMYYKMDVDMDDIKDWVNMYYIGYNSEYDEGPGDVDYEGNEFGSEDYESEKKELVFDTGEREDFYMHLKDNLSEMAYERDSVEDIVKRIKPILANHPQLKTLEDPDQYLIDFVTKRKKFLNKNEAPIDKDKFTYNVGTTPYDEYINLQFNKYIYSTLTEGKLLKEDSNSIVNLLMKNQREVAKKLNYMEYFPFDEVNIDLEGDASIVLQDEAGGLSFRYPEDVDSKFVGQNGDKPRPVTIGGVDLMYIGYNI